MGIWLSLSLGAALAASAVVWLSGTLYVRVTRCTLPSASVREPVTIVQVTDLHGRLRYLNGRLADLVNRQKPDLVVVTGDLASRQADLPAVLKELRRVRSPLPVLFVPGNYEREEATGVLRKRPVDGDRALEQIASAGLRVLANQWTELEAGGGRIAVYGFDNSLYSLARFPSPADVTRHRAGLGSDSSPPAFLLMLAHSPSIIKGIKERRLPFDLLLAGHTHGGQIRPFGRTLSAYGRYHIGTRLLPDGGRFGISRGLGTVHLPLRLHCPPELAVYRLVPDSPSG
ncbi:hypothetical protein J31TS4_12500 [Paenibacillus sp. J31TS4]|uniref:metallophosphoesterase n=1 Tax=Paenibacillus sp. J31TS4 TaxID=2807195 RepID=UPI001B1D4C8A|nr:metallophosphoesterase [Paenibacillus sp. J31TS4]GIP37970.1 hypothetical protein J31TS4_12500 [Paenibacillus sp. J31TS4]